MSPWRNVWRRALCAMSVFFCVMTQAHAENITVYAAASMTNALQDIATAYHIKTGQNITLSFASSALLAKQIEAGAPADIFISADKKWMDYLQARALIQKNTRRDVAGNTLVLIAPASAKIIFTSNNKPAPMPVLNGHLCMADSASVPAGIYGKQALQFLGWWTAWQPKIINTDDVRATLAFVEREHCALGVVYATDAAASARVKIITHFSARSHDAVVYPAALLPKAAAPARDFFNFLFTAPAQKIIMHHGFSAPAQN